MRGHIVTICARNYSSLASALGDSVQRHHPEKLYSVWLLDFKGIEDLPSNVQYRDVRDCMSPQLWDELTFRYSILELSTAVKPFVLRYLFEHGAETVTYFDPDIFLFSPMNEVFETLGAGASGVIIPHMLKPFPKDGERPGDLDILQSGIYNLGFISLRRCSDTLEFLGWWSAWLETHCYSDPALGIFTDQKWINFAPIFWPSIYVLRHLGYDVAYWNLHERQLLLHGDQYRIDDYPLVFFHFSGFNANTPSVLSKYDTRFKVQEGSDLSKILRFYGNEVNSRGFEITRNINLPVESFVDGVPVDWLVRLLYRKAKTRGLKVCHPRNVGPGSFRAYIGQANRSEPLSPYFNEVVRLRQDLNPLSALGGRQALVDWLRRTGAMELGVMSEVIEPDITHAVRYSFAAFHISEGNSCGYARIFDHLGISPYWIDPRAADPIEMSDPEREFDFLEVLPPSNIVFLRCSIDELENLKESIQLALVPGFPVVIGILDGLSSSISKGSTQSLANLDEIWVTSTYLASKLSKSTLRSVLQIPPVISPLDVQSKRSELGYLESDILFLIAVTPESAQDWRIASEVVAAFEASFANVKGRLLLIAILGENVPEVETRVAIWSKKNFVNAMRMSDAIASMNELLMTCDVFVDLNLYEGIDIRLGTAMSLGKAVIGAAFGGNLDFMTPENSFLISPDLDSDEVYRNLEGGARLQDTPEPATRIEGIAVVLKKLGDSSETRIRLGTNAKAVSLSKFSVEVVSRLVNERLLSLTQDNKKKPDKFTTGTTRRATFQKLRRDVIKHPFIYLRKVPVLFKVFVMTGLGGVKRTILELATREDSSI
jgi:hypothetical protein